MKKVLVAFGTNSGSTAEVAQAVADELGKAGAQVDVRRLEEVGDLEEYDTVVVGAPMILGWQRAALKFLRKHKAQLSTKKTAYFMTAMSLTNTGDTSVDGVPVYIDEGLAKMPKQAGKLSFRESYATVSRYLRPVLRAAKTVRPLSVAFFGGKLELFRLKPLQMLFVMLVVGAQPGDLRNWDTIRGWAGELRAKLEEN